MESASRRGETIATPTWLEYDTNWRHAVRDFQIAARSELGIDSRVPDVDITPMHAFRDEGPSGTEGISGEL